MASAIDECCGLGCNNCILDQFLDVPGRRITAEKTLFNLFNQKGYQKFKVKHIKKEREHVYQFTFELCCERDEPFKKDEQLLAPPISYLMLRAPRNFNDKPTKPNPIFDDIEGFLGPSEEEIKKSVYFRSQPQRFDKGTPEIYFSRKYTPFEVNEELRTFKVLIKLEQNGKMSKYLTRLHVGSVCEFKGPFEAFKYVKEAIENYIVFTQGNYQRMWLTCFLSANMFLGISIVSAFRLVKEVIYESAQSRVLVVSCFKNLNEAFLREDFFMLTHCWCLKNHIFLSNVIEPEIPPRYDEKIHHERLCNENFRDLMKELKFYDPENTQVLISGRESFIEVIKSIVKENRYKNVATIWKLLTGACLMWYLKYLY